MYGYVWFICLFSDVHIHFVNSYYLITKQFHGAIQNPECSSVICKQRSGAPPDFPFYKVFHQGRLSHEILALAVMCDPTHARTIAQLTHSLDF